MNWFYLASPNGTVWKIVVNGDQTFTITAEAGDWSPVTLISRNGAAYDLNISNAGSLSTSASAPNGIAQAVFPVGEYALVVDDAGAVSQTTITGIWVRTDSAQPWVDYSESLFIPNGLEGSKNFSFKRTSELNVPPKLQLMLAPDPYDPDALTPLQRGSEIKVTSSLYGVLFRGYVIEEPTRVPVGEDNGNNLYAWSIAAAGEEILLDFNRIGYVEPYIDKTEGYILADLIERFQPGRFDTSGINTFGSQIELFAISPTEHFSEIKKRLFAGRSLKLWFVDGVAYLARLDEKLLDNPSFDDWSLLDVPDYWADGGTGGVISRDTSMACSDAALKLITGASVTQLVDGWLASSTLHTARILVAKTAGLVAGNLVIQVGGATVLTVAHSSAYSDRFAAFEFSFTTGTVGPATTLKITASGVTAGEGFIVDALAIFPGGDMLEPLLSEYDDLYNPYPIEISPITNPIINDITGFGAVEPFDYVHEHMVGDGYTANFGLKVLVEGTTGKPIADDEFSSNQLDTTRWTIYDDIDVFQMFEGRLNIEGGAGLNVSKMVLSSPVLLHGKNDLCIGEWQFIAASDGIVGGIYSSPTAMTLLNCLLGYRLTKSSGQTLIQPIVDGVVQTTAAITTQADKTYTLRIFIDQPSTTLSQIERWSRRKAFATDDTAIEVPPLNLIFTVEENDAVQVVDPMRKQLLMASVSNPPSVAYYCQANAVDMHAVVNYFSLTSPIQAVLLQKKVPVRIQSSGGSSAEKYFYLGDVPSENGVEYEVGVFIRNLGAATVTVGSSLGTVGTVAVGEDIQVSKKFTGDGVNNIDLFFSSSSALDILVASPWIVKTSQRSINLVVAECQRFEPFFSPPITGWQEYGGAEVTITDPAPLSLGRLTSGERLMRVGYQGQSDADATIIDSGNGHMLAYFNFTRPDAMELVQLDYRGARNAYRRVMSIDSIEDESARYGDNGIRAAMITQWDQIPENSEELDTALRALVDDGIHDKFEGRWAVSSPEWTFPVDFYPGRMIQTYLPGRLDKRGFNAQIRTIEMTLWCDPTGLEHFDYVLGFGEQLSQRLDNVISQLSRRVRQQDSLIAQAQQPRTDITGWELLQVATAYAPDIPDVRLTDRSASLFTLDAGRDLASTPASGEFIEIRNSDQGWGPGGETNLLSRAFTRLFTVPRVRRGQHFYCKLCQVTNWLLYANDFSNAAWTLDGTFTFTPNNVLNPTNLQKTAQLLTVANGGAGRYFQQISGTSVSSQTVTAGVWIKKGTLDGVTVELRIGGAAAASKTFTELKAGWNFVSVSASGSGAIGIRVYPGTSSNSGKSGTMYVYCPQVEIGAAITHPVVPTQAIPHGRLSRRPTFMHFQWPLVPDSPVCTVGYDETTGFPAIDVTLPTPKLDVWGYEVRSDAGTVVPSAAGPWLFTGGINASLPYADDIGGGNIPPSETYVVPHMFAEGDVVEIRYVEGLVKTSTADSVPWVGPVGDLDYSGLGPFNAHHPAYYAEGASGSVIGENGLMGAWCDDNGVVIDPFMVLYGGQFQCPPGATRLQLGMNEDTFGSGQQGSFTLLIWVNDVLIGEGLGTSSVLDKVTVGEPSFSTHWLQRSLPRVLSQYRVRTFNLLSEFSDEVVVDADPVMPRVSDLAVDDETKVLSWEGVGWRYRVEISADEDFSVLTFQKVTRDKFLQLLDPDFFPFRYIRVTAYDGLGDGGYQQITHEYVVEPPIIVPGPPPTATITGSVHKNGWSDQSHVGDWEEDGGARAHSEPMIISSNGEGVPFNYALAYDNASAAVDNLDATPASKTFQHQHAYAACVWKFSSPATSLNGLKLNVLSEVNGDIITGRSAAIWYTTGGAASETDGSLWTKLYETPNDSRRAKQWDTVTLPDGTNPNNVRVMAFMDAHDNMSHKVFTVKLDLAASGEGVQ